MTTRPSQTKTFIFSACTHAEHSDCRGEQIVQNTNDLSQPRVLHICGCKCHRESRVKIEFRMLLGQCNAGQHSKCMKRVTDAKNLNKIYICNCKCHRQGEPNVES